MGELSRKAQGLGQIVTSYEKLSANDDILFLKVFQNKVQGILRIGKKNLFYSDRTGKMINIQPMCLLDFYIHESCQRSGIGKTKENANLNSNKSELPIQNQQLDSKQISQNNSYQQQKYMAHGHQSNNSLNQNNFQQAYYNSGINNSQYNSNTNPLQQQQFHNGNKQYNSQPNQKQQNYHYSDKNSHTYIDEQLKYDYTPEAKQLRQKSIQEQEEELIKLQKEIEHLNFNKQQDIASSSQYKQYRQPNHGIFGHYNYGKTFQTSSNSYGQGSGYRF
ncbi:hypothetical protein PPERSA_07969 [Pseudocohnilembus persalinus]|uniref:N-acetyltransferase domain-containing protein n=1 Tax=Pseudocohnilembus persalinus TaxID=266149 RepID=A0A0V0QB59_PSEPJ|nr:hypothetical protein PPERSA_07969 [Pseudocohnilembus persalinus]|eukprot:KRW99484.1 hypothetical protein PPERSA_07969 [Pseudocohnilembus persalinus]